MLVVRCARPADFDQRFSHAVMSGEHRSHGDLYRRLKHEHDHHLASPFAMSIVIESVPQREIQAYFSATFVHEDANQFLLDVSKGIYPYPKLLDLERSRCPIYPSFDEVSHSEGGLFLWFFIAFLNDGLAGDVAARIKSQIARAWLERYRGFKLSGIYFSLSDKHLESTVDLGMLPVYQGTDQWGNGVALAGRTKEQVTTCGNPFINELFAWSPPTVQFTPAEKELLYLASYSEESDLALADALSVGTEAVRARWKSAALKVRPATLCAEDKAPWGSVRRELVRFASRNRSSVWPAPIMPNTRSAVERLCGEACL